MVDRLVAVDDADYRLPEPVRQVLDETTSDRTGYVDPRIFGAVIDGVTDDTSAYQVAANYARDTGRTLYVPPGDTRLNGRVTVASSVRCDGVVRIAGGTNGGFDFVRKLERTVVDATTLGSLTKGTTSIPGLPNGVGTIYVQNVGEPMIRRYTAAGVEQPAYYKADVCEVIFPGVLGQPLHNTYDDLATTTVFFFPREDTTTVDGLNIIVDGTSLATGSRIDAYFSNAVFNDLSVVNGSTVEQLSPCVVRWGADIAFNRPNIVGFYHADAGYGIQGSTTANMRIYNGTITGCRHAISGQKNKDLLVDGGTYEGGIDDHWTFGMTVRNLSNVIRADSLTPSHVHTAGFGDVTVENCDFTGGSWIVSIRSDTPELEGVITVDKVKFKTDLAGTHSLVSYYSTFLPDRDWGHPYLARPRVVFKDCDVERTTAGDLYVVNLAGGNFDTTASDEIVVEKVRVVSPSRWTAVYLSAHTNLRPADDAGTIIRIKDCVFPVGVNADSSVIVQNPSGGQTNDVQAFTLDITDCENVRVAFAEDAVKLIRVKGSTVRGIVRSGALASTLARRVELAENRLIALNATGFWTADFVNNTWEGAAVSTNIGYDSRVDSYRGNLHTVGATGHPTRASGYVNTTKYQTLPAPIG